MGLGSSKFGRTYGRPRRMLARISEPYVISGTTCLAVSDKAIKIDTGRNGTWIPRKAVHPSSQVREKDDKGRMVIQRWFAKDRRWVKD